MEYAGLIASESNNGYMWQNNVTPLNASNMNRLNRLLHDVGDDLFNDQSEKSATTLKRVTNTRDFLFGSSLGSYMDYGVQSGVVPSIKDMNDNMYTRHVQMLHTLFKAVPLGMDFRDKELFKSNYQYDYNFTDLLNWTYTIWTASDYDISEKQCVGEHNTTCTFSSHGLFNITDRGTDFPTRRLVAGWVPDMTQSVGELYQSVSNHYSTYTEDKITTTKSGWGALVDWSGDYPLLSSTFHMTHKSGTGPSVSKYSIVTIGDSNDYEKTGSEETVNARTWWGLNKRITTLTNLLAKENFIGVIASVSFSCKSGTDQYKEVGTAVIDGVTCSRRLPKYKYNPQGEATNNESTGVTIKSESKPSDVVSEGSKNYFYSVTFSVKDAYSPYNKLLLTDDASKITATQLKDQLGTAATISGDDVTITKTLEIVGCYKGYIKMGTDLEISGALNTSTGSLSNDSNSSSWLCYSANTNMKHTNEGGENSILVVIPCAKDSSEKVDFELRDVNDSKTNWADYLDEDNIVTLNSGKSYYIALLKFNSPLSANHTYKLTLV